MQARVANLQPLSLTYLPERSRFDDERRVLDNLPLTGESEETRQFVERRKQFCASAPTVEDESPFWVDRVTPHSLYGDGVAAPVVFAAVGRAIETKRLLAAERIFQSFGSSRCALSGAEKRGDFQLLCRAL